MLPAARQGKSEARVERGGDDVGRVELLFLRLHPSFAASGKIAFPVQQLIFWLPPIC